MKLEPKPGAVKLVTEKRCYMPVVLRGECPNCHGEYSRDFDDTYLTEPPCGVPFGETMWCPRCEHEWDVTLRLDVTLSLVAPSEGMNR